MSDLVVNCENKLRKSKKKLSVQLSSAYPTHNSLIQTYAAIPDKFREWSQKIWNKL